MHAEIQYLIKAQRLADPSASLSVHHWQLQVTMSHICSGLLLASDTAPVCRALISGRLARAASTLFDSITDLDKGKKKALSIAIRYDNLATQWPSEKFKLRSSHKDPDSIRKLLVGRRYT